MTNKKRKKILSIEFIWGWREWKMHRLGFYIRNKSQHIIYLLNNTNILNEFIFPILFDMNHQNFILHRKREKEKKIRNCVIKTIEKIWTHYDIQTSFHFIIHFKQEIESQIQLKHNYRLFFLFNYILFDFHELELLLFKIQVTFRFYIMFITFIIWCSNATLTHKWIYDLYAKMISKKRITEK